MSQYNQDLIQTLNDLVVINNDRIAGYNNAISNVEAEDVDLKATFENMKSNSEKHIQQLQQQIRNLGGNIEEGTTLAGKLYRAWMDVKSTFSGYSREAALETCIYGDTAAIKVYEDALAGDADMSTEVRQVIATQMKDISDDLTKIRAFENIQEKIAG